MWPKRLKDCPVCKKKLIEHDLQESLACLSTADEKEKIFEDWSTALHERTLVLKEPERLTNGSHCRECGCWLPGEWGAAPAIPKDRKNPDARMCGACLRAIKHNCYDNAEHISEADSYMGARDGTDYWSCKICHRTIDVGEFIKNRKKNRI